MLIFDELRKNDPRLRALTWTLLAGMGILVLGLYFVQIISSLDYVEDQRTQSFRTIRIPGIRGKIMDRQGRPLAENRPAYQVSLFLNELRDLFTHHYTNDVVPDTAGPTRT